jgi:septal ring factor EnvC (AmiA/AmiB activator)
MVGAEKQVNSERRRQMTDRTNVLHRILRAQEERLADVDYEYNRLSLKLKSVALERAEINDNIARIKRELAEGGNE